MRPIFYLVPVILSIFIYVWFVELNLTKNQIESGWKRKFEQLNKQDKEYLNNFFKYTFFMSNFGFTVFGSKPMSFETINLAYQPNVENDIDYMNIHHIFNRYKLKECWETWSKYSRFFDLRGYTIFSYPSPLDSNYLEIVIINHANFIRTVKENLKDFHAGLENQFTPEEILNEYLKGKGKIFNYIRNHDGLFGTLLGYGHYNSWEYIQQKGGEQMASNYPPLFDEPRDTEHVLRPAFKVKSLTSEETQNLLNIYEKERIKINKIFQSNNFLEQVLNQLTDNTISEI